MNPARVVHSFFRSRWLMRRFARRDELERWQDRQVLAHLRWVRERSSYYRELYQSLDEHRWRQFPVSDKRVMVEDFDRSNTGNIIARDLVRIAELAVSSRDFSQRLRGHSIGLSSGTSGKRSLFASSSRENDIWAGALLARVLRSPVSSCQKIGFYHRANNTLYSHVRLGLIEVRFFDLLQDLSQLLVETHHYQPRMLVGPPAMLRELADAQNAGEICIRPEKIVSIAEQLDPMDQSRIESVFQVRMDQLYVATEGFIAATCRLGRMHLCEDLMVVQEELLCGDHDRFVPILTDFLRRVQPVIRYRLSDVLIRSEVPCKCGSIFRSIEKIEGRCDDQLVFERRSGETIPLLVFPDFIREVITSLPAIEAFRVRQVSMGHLQLMLKTAPSVQASVRCDLEQRLLLLFDRLNVVAPNIDFHDYAVDLARGKLRRVERCFSHPSAETRKATPV